MASSESLGGESSQEHILSDKTPANLGAEPDTDPTAGLEGLDDLIIRRVLQYSPPQIITGGPNNDALSRIHSHYDDRSKE